MTNSRLKHHTKIHLLLLVVTFSLSGIITTSAFNLKDGRSHPELKSRIQRVLQIDSRSSSDCSLYHHGMSFELSTGRSMKFSACSRSLAMKHYLISRSPTTTLSSSVSDGHDSDAIPAKRQGFLWTVQRKILAKLRFLILFPLKVFLYPLRLFAKNVVEEMVDDGTMIINTTSREETASLQKYNQAPRSMEADITINEIEGGDNELLSEASAVDASAAVSVSSIVPPGERWAIAAKGVDLSGSWDLIVTDEFKVDYDNYLTSLGQPFLVRSVAMGIIGRTKEETTQLDNGRSLLIRGTNLRGVWDRTLVASGSEIGKEEYTRLQIPVMTADSEAVEAESWWEEKGTVHVSWLRGVTRYGGGAFESKRFLEDDGQTYVCESTFHPKDKSKEPSSITWRFQRQPETDSTLL